MRSPIIAFSLFAAAVSPTLVSAAPPSPKLGGDTISHQRNTEIRFPQRFAFPRGTDSGVLNKLPLDDSSLLRTIDGDKPGLPGNNNQGNAQPADPSSGATKAVDPVLADSPAQEVNAAEKGRDPNTPIIPDGRGRVPKTGTPGGAGPRGSAGKGNGEGNGEGNGQGNGQNNTP